VFDLCSQPILQTAIVRYCIQKACQFLLNKGNSEYLYIWLEKQIPALISEIRQKENAELQRLFVLGNILHSS
jgi:hypothetical protein